MTDIKPYIAHLMPTDEELELLAQASAPNSPAPLVVNNNSPARKAAPPAPVVIPSSPGELALSEELLEQLDEEVEEMDDDFQMVRTNMQKAITSSATSLADAIDVAKASDHPQAFQAVSKLLNSLSFAARDLLELHEKRMQIKSHIRREKTLNKPKVENNTNNTTNNNLVFAGTTKDLLDAVLKNNKG